MNTSPEQLSAEDVAWKAYDDALQAEDKRHQQAMAEVNRLIGEWHRIYERRFAATAEDVAKMVEEKL